MNVRSLALLTALSAVLVSSAAETAAKPAEASGLLPARALLVPCETEDLAIAIANGKAKASDSRFLISLDGEWDFSWKSSAAATWEKTAKIAVPGCWQLQGAYDPVVGFDAKTTPVGCYATTFKRPWRWYFRRTVLRLAGVSGAVVVRVNGKVAGSSLETCLPCEFDVSRQLKWFGRNRIEVEVSAGAGCTKKGCTPFRLAGLSGSVSLVSEARKAPKNLIAETWLSDDYASARFTIRDENGRSLKEREVPNPRLWDAEAPCVYVTPIEHKWGWWFLSGTDYYTVSLGFRRVEVKDGKPYLNGHPLAVRGVSRCAVDPVHGFALTDADLAADMKALKSLNAMTARNCRGADDPRWYDLCDKDGLMAVCEAGPDSPERLTGFLRNHPCVLATSADEKTFAAFRSACAPRLADLAFGPEGAPLKPLNTDGLLTARREQKPEAAKLKYVYRPVRVTAFDWKTGEGTVFNAYHSSALEYISAMVILEKGGQKVASRWLDVDDLTPGKTKKVKVEAAEADTVIFRFLDGREEVSREKFVRPAK